MSKLVDGCIPAGTVCPWKDECPMGAELCKHTGVDHAVPFSCAIARSFEICEKEEDARDV